MASVGVACRKQRTVWHDGGEVFRFSEVASAHSILWAELFKPRERALLHEKLQEERLDLLLAETYAITAKLLWQPDAAHAPKRGPRPGRTALLLHAVDDPEQSAWLWVKLMRPLYERGFSVVMLDLPGFGGSTMRNQGNVEIGKWLRLAHQVIESALDELFVDKVNVVAARGAWEIFVQLLEHVPKRLARGHVFHNPVWDIDRDTQKGKPRAGMSITEWMQQIRDIRFQNLCVALQRAQCHVMATFDEMEPAFPMDMRERLRNQAGANSENSSIVVHALTKRDICEVRAGSNIPDRVYVLSRPLTCAYAGHLDSPALTPPPRQSIDSQSGVRSSLPEPQQPGVGPRPVSAAASRSSTRLEAEPTGAACPSRSDLCQSIVSRSSVGPSRPEPRKPAVGPRPLSAASSQTSTRLESLVSHSSVGSSRPEPQQPGVGQRPVSAEASRSSTRLEAQPAGAACPSRSDPRQSFVSQFDAGSSRLEPQQPGIRPRPVSAVASRSTTRLESFVSHSSVGSSRPEPQQPGVGQRPVSAAASRSSTRLEAEPAGAACLSRSDPRQSFVSQSGVGSSRLEPQQPGIRPRPLSAVASRSSTLLEAEPSGAACPSRPSARQSERFGAFASAAAPPTSGSASRSTSRLAEAPRSGAGGTSPVTGLGTTLPGEGAMPPAGAAPRLAFSREELPQQSATAESSPSAASLGFGVIERGPANEDSQRRRSRRGSGSLGARRKPHGIDQCASEARRVLPKETSNKQNITSTPKEMQPVFLDHLTEEVRFDKGVSQHERELTADALEASAQDIVDRASLTLAKSKDVNDRRRLWKECSGAATSSACVVS